ncbi:MAG: ABC transporter substrate-binding protein [Thermomicrobia bacterium]|nr:ABC transporter substrate-binding protein [Thermomicrobia bacterium]
MTIPRTRAIAIVAIGLLISIALTACGSSTAATATPGATTAPANASAARPTSAATAVTSPSVAPGSTTAASSAPASAAKPSGPADTVKVVHVPGLFFAPLYVAIDQGFFKEQNIDISLDKAASGAEVMAFLAQGQIDVGAVGLSAATFNTFAKGFDFKVIASAGIAPQTNGPSKFEVRKALVDSGQVKTIADLKGKKVAVAGGTGSAGAYLAVKALQTAGLTAKDVQFVNLANPDMVQALANGAVDAALIGTPFSTQAIQQGAGAILVDDFAPGYSTTTFMYSGRLIKERPDVARRFAIALLKGYRAIQGANYLSDANLQTYIKYTGSTDKVIRATPPFVYDPNMAIKTESIKDQEKVYRESGWTDYTQTTDISKLFDPSFAQAAVTTVGPAG